MYGRHHLSLLIHQRHKEALREAQTRRLAKQARSDRSRRLRRAGPLRRALASLRAAPHPSHAPTVELTE